MRREQYARFYKHLCRDEWEFHIACVISKLIIVIVMWLVIVSECSTPSSLRGSAWHNEAIYKAGFYNLDFTLDSGLLDSALILFLDTGFVDCHTRLLARNENGEF